MPRLSSREPLLTCARWRLVDFADRPNGDVSPELKGIIAASYSLGAVLSLPFIGMVNDKLGRRWSIFGGSAIMVIGAIIQGLSIHCIHSRDAG